MAKSKTLIEYMILRLEEVGAIKIKKIERTGVDEAQVILEEPLSMDKLTAVHHDLDKYYPDGLKGNYVQLDPLPQNGASLIFANVH